MTVRVLVVDDEPLARRGIIRRLLRHADMELIGEAGDGENALQCIVATTPDLVFMDVQMPGMSGLETLRLLPPKDRPLSIFLTAWDRFAVQAFEVHALDYLLKPIDDERFDEALERARMALRRHRQDHRERLHACLQEQAPAFSARFAIRTGHRVSFVNVADIDWIEAQGDYAGLHVGSSMHLLRESLQRLIQQLDPTTFVRIHRSTIVRVDRIAQMQTLSNGVSCAVWARDWRC